MSAAIDFPVSADSRRSRAACAFALGVDVSHFAAGGGFAGAGRNGLDQRRNPNEVVMARGARRTSFG